MKSPEKKYSLKLPGIKEPESIAPHSTPSRLSAGEDEFLKSAFFGNSGLENPVSTTPYSAPTRLSTGDDEFFNRAYLGRSEDKTSGTDGNVSPEDKNMISDTLPPVEFAITQTSEVSDASTQVPELVDVETPVPDFGGENARASRAEGIITQALLQTEDITKALQVEDTTIQAPPRVLDATPEYQRKEETSATPQLAEAFQELKKDISDIFHRLKDELKDSCSNDDFSSDDSSGPAKTTDDSSKAKNV